MARGWESKAVESQIDSAAAVRTVRTDDHPRTPEEIAHETKLHGLMLSRTRVLNDLQTACNPRYREQLLQALDYLDHQIAALDLGSGTH
jgi:hypothetical protein